VFNGLQGCEKPGPKDKNTQIYKPACCTFAKSLPNGKKKRLNNGAKKKSEDLAAPIGHWRLSFFLR
jgi:hypothetical protein